MNGSFSFDVFFCHSNRDKGVVRPIAERLRADGLRVWFDDSEIPAKIEEGLDRSRAIVLCMSANAFGSEWPRLEACTLRFRDALNKERRFIPIRLDDAVINSTVAQFLHLDFRAKVQEEQYTKLIEACRSLKIQPEPKAARERMEQRILSLGHSGAVRSVAFNPDGKLGISCGEDHTIRVWHVESGRCQGVLEGHSASVLSVAWSPDGNSALSGAEDNTVRLWDIRSGRCLRVLKGHAARVLSVSWSPQGRLTLSAAEDSTIRLWDVETGRCLRVLDGHTGSVWSVDWSPDESSAVSAGDDNIVRLWDVGSGRCWRELRGHTDRVRSVAWSPDGGRVLSGALDKTVRVWDVESGHCMRILKGHSEGVRSVAWSSDATRIISGAKDKTARLWEVESGRCLQVLKGHSDSVFSVAWNSDGGRILSGSPDNTVRVWQVKSGRCLRLLDGHSGPVLSVAWSNDNHRALSGSRDRTVRLWDMESGRCLRVMVGHSGSVESVAWSPNSTRAISCATDNTLRLWDVESGRCLRVFKGHSAHVRSVAWSPDGRRLLSGAEDGTLRLWDAETGFCSRSLEGHAGGVWTVVWSSDGGRALSGGEDGKLRLWDVASGQCMRVLEGHFDGVECVCWSPDGGLALSSSYDTTVRLWDLDSGQCLRVLEGHTARVWSAAWSPDGHRALSSADDRTVRVWDVESGLCLHVLEGHSARVWNVAWDRNGGRAFSAAGNGVMRVWDLETAGVTSNQEAAQVQYSNAKVLLAGEPGAGKTGLAMRLAQNAWEPTKSTAGARVTQWKLPELSAEGVERDIWLWDFAGQPGLRLIDQLDMEEITLAVLVFDGRKEDPIDLLIQWDRTLMRASRKPFKKLLVAARVDSAVLRVSRGRLETFVRERGFAGYIETSARQNTGCQELKDAILSLINWEDIPYRSAPPLFRRIEEEIVRLKAEGRVLMRFNELRDALRLRMAGGGADLRDEELKAVLGPLANAGGRSCPSVVQELTFGSWVLLQPERMNAYAQAVVETLCALGWEGGIAEESVLSGDLMYPTSIERLPAVEERFVLLAMHEAFVKRGLCLREQTESGFVLIFPSYCRRECPELDARQAVQVRYRFDGFLDDIYSTLVVRLHHTGVFQKDRLWRYGADFKIRSGEQLGVRLTRRADGSGDLEVYFDPEIPLDEKITFSRCIYEHLLEKGKDVVRLRHYVCPNCGTPVLDLERAMRKLEEGRQRTGISWRTPTIICQECEKRIQLWDELEQSFASAEMQRQVRELQVQSALKLEDEGKERALVGDVMSTVANAGQISREYLLSGYGIDMEIEFKDDLGERSGYKLYLQLKAGDSYLRERRRDGAQIFTIKDDGRARYWMEQPFPVLLVIRNADGELRWMEVGEWLKRATDNGQKPVKQIVFEGERFDVMSIRHWRATLTPPQTIEIDSAITSGQSA